MFACSLINLLWLMTITCSKRQHTNARTVQAHKTKTSNERVNKHRVHCSTPVPSQSITFPDTAGRLYPLAHYTAGRLYLPAHYTPGHSWMIIFPGSLHSGTAGPLYPLAHYTAGPLYPLAHYTPRYSWPITLPDQLDYQNSLNLQTWLLKCEVSRILS